MKNNVAEGVGRRRKAHRCAGFIGLAHNRKRGLRDAVGIGLLKQFALAPDGQL